MESDRNAFQIRFIVRVSMQAQLSSYEKIQAEQKPARKFSQTTINLGNECLNLLKRNEREIFIL